jgi:hypothetical protein
VTQMFHPHERLIDYYDISIAVRTSRPPEEEDRNHALSDVDLNIMLLERLDAEGLLGIHTDVVDCGFGVGFALYDLYLQSLSVPGRTFTFRGIEDCTYYLELVETNLLHMWDGRLDLVRGDVRDHDYHRYGLVYSHSPFRRMDTTRRFYRMVADQMASGAVLVENRNSGLGLHGVLTEIPGLEKIILGDVCVFRKR